MHSREVANLCSIMAAELGLNSNLQKGRLLHDIGKVPDDEPELPHAILWDEKWLKNHQGETNCMHISGFSYIFQPFSSRIACGNSGSSSGTLPICEEVRPFCKF